MVIIFIKEDHKYYEYLREPHTTYRSSLCCLVATYQLPLLTDQNETRSTKTVILIPSAI